MINIAVLGHGVVGSGTAAVLMSKAAQLKQAAGQDINLKYVLVRHDYDVDYKEKFVYDFETIENDSEVGVVVEAIGGIDPALDYVSRALKKGKSVVTSNKQLVARHGRRLMRLAEKNGANFMFEAAVGGAVPVIHRVRNCLKANTVTEIAGILNGTTNYILTKMIEEKLSFDTALKQAQELGYAEADPSADVDGLDTCRKICILADIVFGRNVDPSQVVTEGIRGIRARDVEILRRSGACIKLLGVARSTDSGLMVITAPFVVFRKGILYAADDVFNAVQIETDNAGTMAFYGRGAGSLPTASAVVNDICECAVNSAAAYSGWSRQRARLADSGDVKMSFYVNISGDEDIHSLFPGAQIISRESEKAFFVQGLSLRQLEKQLEGICVNSVIRVL